MAGIEDHASSETYLARPVLLHGGLTPKPWVNYNDLKLKFTSTIEKVTLLSMVHFFLVWLVFI